MTKAKWYFDRLMGSNPPPSEREVLEALLPAVHEAAQREDKKKREDLAEFRKQWELRGGRRRWFLLVQSARKRAAHLSAA